MSVASSLNTLSNPSYEELRVPRPPAIMTTALALTAAVALERNYRTIFMPRSSREAATATYYNHDGGDSDIFFIPGCRSDGKLLGELLHGVMATESKAGTISFLDYPERGFSGDSMKESLIESKSRIAAETGECDRSTIIGASSMGGMTAAHILKDADFRRKIGPVKHILMDSSPSEFQDLAAESRKLINLAGVLGGSELGFLAASRRVNKRVMTPGDHDDTISEDVAVQIYQSVAKTRPPAIYAQGKFMKRNPVLGISLRGVAEKITYISSSKDDVVNIDHAREVYEQVYGSIDVIVDNERPEVSHAAGTRYPGFISRLMRQSS